ncbi:MAG: ABC transporter permease [Cyclobacteriaceae bacterium]
MLKNYLKTAVRSLLRQRVFTLINVMGLSVSITACLLIVLYVNHELSYDTFYAHGDRIYKLALERKYPNHVTFYSVVPHSFARTIQQDFPEVDQTLLLFGPNKNTVINYKVSDSEIKTFEEDFVIQADSNFFAFFDIGLKQGDPATALSLGNQVIISERAAHKYFGQDDPIGKVLGGDFGEVKVTGVFENLPEQTHLKFDFVGSVAGAPFLKQENFSSFDSHIYVKLKQGTDYKALEAKFPAMVDAYAAAQIEKKLGKSWADYQRAGNGYRYFFQPLRSIHLDPTNLEFTMSPSGNIRYVWVLSFIAMMILVIACINFMNLATARSAERAREVGVRKVMGSVRTQLMAQFLIEAILLSILGTAIAVVGAWLLMPSFNVLVERQLAFSLSLPVLGGLIAFSVMTGLLAGFYPAVVLSGFNPVIVMKGKFTGNRSGTWLRNGLVVFQFAVSIVLIIGTLVVGNQMQFMARMNLGFQRDQVFLVDGVFSMRDKARTFLEEARRVDGVKFAMLSSARLGNRDDFFGEQFIPEGGDEVLTVKTMFTDDDLDKVMGLQLVDGVFFNEQTNDSLHVIINEAAARTMGAANPVGMRLTKVVENEDGSRTNKVMKVIGVVSDFHFQSLHDEITPLTIESIEQFGKGASGRVLAARFEPSKYSTVQAGIERIWKELMPGQPFRYELLDEMLKRSYVEDERSGKLFALFSALAIVIACVGLFGLSAYTASLRTREIGIRKVLGATVTGVTLLLARDFLLLVALAFLIAVPLGWWMMNSWLANFAYRTALGPDIFVLAGIAAFLIAFVTVSYQSVRAAIVNPAKSLKSE